MSIGASVVIGDKRTASVVTVDNLALFAYDTSDSGNDGEGKLASGASLRSKLVERIFVDTFDNIDFTVITRLVVADGPVCGSSTTIVGHRPHISEEEIHGVVFLLQVDLKAGRNLVKSAIEQCRTKCTSY